MRFSARGVAHTYLGRPGEVPVLAGVSFEIPAGGHAALVGPSGAGKTTLLA